MVNFAAESHVDRSIDDPSAFVTTNVVGTFELLEAARRFLDEHPDLRESFRFLHVSTDEVYGSLGETGLFTETTPYAPNSPYAASKAGADHLVRAYHETYGLPALVTNCSNNYGPYQFPEKLIPLMILNALEGRDLPVYGDGSNVRDWIYVEDHCRGVLRALETGRPGEKYNLGGRSERTNLEIVHLLCDLLEEARPAADNPALRQRGLGSYRELVTFVSDRPGHDRRYAIDDEKARTELGWQPRHDLATGLAATVRWYLGHAEWCERIQSGVYRRERLGLGASSEADAEPADEVPRDRPARRPGGRADGPPRPPGLLPRDLPPRKYAEHGIDGAFVQDNHSRSEGAILRGLHAQGRRPQGKLVRAVEGTIFDVAVDIRVGSPTFGRWVGVELSAESFRQLWVPPGFAHGFCVLTGAAQVEYKCTDLYAPDDELTVAWDDPEIGVAWPLDEPVLSDKDRRAKTLAELAEAGALPVYPNAHVE